MHEISNVVFLQTIFGQNYPYAHITDFYDDPGNIADWRRGICWAGGAASEYECSPGTNQYFTISIFKRHPQVPHRSFRRKSLFLATYCIVADDVHEKIDSQQIKRLPEPTWKLETSPGNEQWGWALQEPEQDRSKVENLLDGLVALGLAPDGKDPGMKGATRYVRLPEGYNRKAKNLSPDNVGFKCRLTEWNPERKTSMEDLAQPFGIDLSAARSETNGTLVELADGDGLDLSEHHAALKYLDIRGQIKTGHFATVCPWLEQHTGRDPSGTAVILLAGHRVGFKCHHGHCEHRTWADVLAVLPPDWMLEDMPAPGGEPTESLPLEQDLSELSLEELARRASTLSSEDLEGQREVLRATRRLGSLEQNYIRNAMTDSSVMSASGFDKALKEVIREARQARSQTENSLPAGEGSRYVFVGEQNAFWDLRGQVFISREGYNGMYGATAELAEEETPAQQLLQWCPKATRLTYHPGANSGVTTLSGVEVVNMWQAGPVCPHYEADPGPWLQHVELLVPNKFERETLLDWLAWTVQHQDQKSNWQILLAGYQGSGKDTLFLPLKRIIGQDNTIEIPAERLLEEFEDYLKSKLLIVQEVENFEKAKVQNKLKRILASTAGGRIPEQISIRNFGSKPTKAPNLVQTIFMSNHRESALQVARDDRRIFAIWSEFQPDDSKEWEKYFIELHQWLHWNGSTGEEHPQGYGIEIVCAYLLDRDVSGFNPYSRAPETEYKRHLKKYSRTNTEMIVEEAVEDRVGPTRFDLVNATVLQEWIEKRRKETTSIKQLTKTMSRLGYQVFHDKGKVKGSQKVESHRYWAVRRMEEWKAQSPRQRIDAWVKHGVKHNLFDDEPPPSW